MQQHNLRRPLNVGKCACTGLIWLLSSAACQAKCASPAAPLGTVRIQGTTAFAGLLEFAISKNICLGIELADAELLRSPVDLRLPEATGLTAIRGALVPFPKYSVSGGSAVSVRATVRARTWLDYKIRSFKIPRAIVQDASNVLFMEMQDQISPRQGYAGHYHVIDSTDMVGPFDEKDRTVREILNLIVTESKAAAWVTVAPYSMSHGQAPGRFWTILQYADPALKHRASIQTLEQRILDAFNW